MSYYYTRDHLGSVRELLNSSGTIVSRLGYDPYGKMTVVSGTNLPTKQYTGDYYHATSGLNLTKYRAFDSDTGRWLSRDPVAEKGGIDLYGYCLNSPVNLIDPRGLSSTTLTITITPQGPFNNSTVDITAKSDCCKNITFIQYVNTSFVIPPWSGGTQLDNGNSPQYQSPNSPPWQYPNIPQSGNGTATMEDAPGPSGLMRIPSVVMGLSQDFVTCAICRDAGPMNNKILGCIHWRVFNNGVMEGGSAGPYTGN
jgi:RHS repeat-associated protein